MGFAHALEHGFDWVWIFDADSVPEPDALEKLLAFFERRRRGCPVDCRCAARRRGGLPPFVANAQRRAGSRNLLPTIRLTRRIARRY
jgi:GT2 family glycosyltransferase